MCRRALLIAAAVGLTAASATAQIRHPGHPNTPVEDVVKERMKAQNGKLAMVWVTEEAVVPLADPEVPSSGVKRTDPLKFLQVCYNGGDFQNHYLLVEFGVGNAIVPVGWVQKDRVLTRPIAEFNRNNLIFQKGMIVNTVDTFLDKTVQNDELPIRRAPNEKAPPDPNKKLRLFNIFFVYGQATDADKKSHVLLGSNPTFDPDPNPENLSHVSRVILGWVPRERVVEWNTRDALEWNRQSTLADEGLRSNLHPARKFDPKNPPRGAPRRTTPGVVYSTPEAADRGLQKAAPLEGDIRALETFDANGEGREMRREEMRFLVLDWVGPPRDPHPAAGTLHRVGVLGGWKNSDGSSGPGAQQIEAYRKKLIELEKAWATTEILLVVDGTDSMAKWFIPIADSLKSLKATILKGRALAPSGLKPAVRIGLVFYNDLTPTNAVAVEPWRPKTARPDQTQVLWDFDAHIDEMIEGLDATPETKNLPRAQQVSNHKFRDGGDRREMVFLGIRKGIDKAGFSPVARKMVVVIGDDGDRNYDDPKFAKYYELYKPEKLVEKLVPGGGSAAIEFYAIQVVNPKDDEQIAFARQMNDIVQLHAQADPDTADRAKAKLGPRAGYATAADADQLYATIEKEYLRMAKQFATDKQILDDMLAGNPPTVLSPEREAIIKKRLDELGDPEMTWDKVRARRGFQLFEIGYVWEKPDGLNSQVRPRLLMNRKDLDSIVTGLGKLDRSPAERPDPKMLVESLVDLMAGDFAPAGEREQWAMTARKELKISSIDVVLRKRAGLKFNSPLFKQLVGDINAGQVEIQHRNDLLFVRDRLQDITKGDWCLYDVKENDAGGIKYRSWKRDDATRQNDETTRRSFNLYGDRSSDWYWIDQWREWP